MWRRAVVPGVAFTVGVMMGNLGGGASAEAIDPTESTAYLALQRDAVRLEEDLRDQEKVAAEAEELNAKLVEEGDALAVREDELDERAAELAQLDADLAALVVELDAREAALAAPAPAPAAAPAPAPAVAPAPDPAPAPAPATVYYKNCDAARAAGAAPVRRGDPGYASHLDRDDDGIGCE